WKSVQEQRADVEAYPDSWSSKAFQQLAESVDAWKQRHEPSGGLTFFFERLVAEKNAKTGGTR
ncbi:MAG: MinD/ParA family protein, partial [Pseudomonadota bacterium]